MTKPKPGKPSVPQYCAPTGERCRTFTRKKANPDGYSHSADGHLRYCLTNGPADYAKRGEQWLRVRAERSA